MSVIISGRQNENNGDNIFNYFWFLIWPIFSFFYAIKNLHFNSSKIIIILYFALSGYFYPFSFSDNIDIVRHAVQFEKSADRPFSDFFKRFPELFVSNQYKPDILQPFIEITTAQFTYNYRVYFAILGAVLGWFLVRLMNIYHQHSFIRRNFFVFLFILFVFILMPPYKLASFRFQAALLYFLFCAFKALVEKKKRYNYLILLSVFIHFGLLGILPVYYLIFVIRKKYTIYYLLVVACFFLSETSLSYVGTYSTEVQGELGERVSSYSSERYIDYVQKIKENRNPIIDNQVRWTAYFFFFILMVLHFKLNKFDEGTQKLYALSLLIFAFIMLVSKSETTLVRYSIMYIILCCLIFVRSITVSNLKLNYLFKFLILLVFTYNLIIMGRKTIEFTGVQAIYPNLFAVIFMDTNESVLSLIK